MFGSRLLIIFLCFIGVSSASMCQSIPAFSKVEGRMMYPNMYNDIVVSLNSVDPGDIAIKCNNAASQRIANDSTYQLYFRNTVEDEIKIKLYYKNLPVDVWTCPMGTAPSLTVSADPIKVSYSADDISQVSLVFSSEDPYFDMSEYKVYSFKAIINGEGLPQGTHMMMNTEKLDRLKTSIAKHPNPQSLTFTEFRFRNKQNQVVNFNSNYFELKLSKK